jgi:hypothetical protein
MIVCQWYNMCYCIDMSAQTVFSQFDTNRDGHLSITEVAQLMTTIRGHGSLGKDAVCSYAHIRSVRSNQ